MGSTIGLFDPKRAMRTRGWRRIGTAIVRWPGPILVASIAVALIGLLALPGYKPPTMPARISRTGPRQGGIHRRRTALLDGPAQPRSADDRIRQGSAHPANMKVLESVARRCSRTRGVAMVQSITRPLGTPGPHSLGFAMSAQSSAQIQNLPFQQARAADLARQIQEINTSIDVLRQQYTLQQQAAAATDEQAAAFRKTVDTVQELRDKVANVDDFFRPIKNYFYWEPHCFDIPVCATFRSLFDALDQVDELTDQFGQVTASLDKLNALQPQLLALIPEQIATQKPTGTLPNRTTPPSPGCSPSRPRH